MYPQLSYSSVACKGNVLSLPYHLHLRKKWVEKATNCNVILFRSSLNSATKFAAAASISLQSNGSSSDKKPKNEQAFS